MQIKTVKNNKNVRVRFRNAAISKMMLHKMQIKCFILDSAIFSDPALKVNCHE